MANNFRLYTLIFLVSLLVACGQNDASETVVLITETAVSPTIPSPTTTYTPTPSPTQTAVPTKLPTATATATATTIPTLTPLPTFAPEELETAVADLLADPMNCDVPCWWGAIPGQTTIDEIEHSITPYNFEISEYYYEADGEPIHVLSLGIGYDEARNSFDIKMGYAFSDSTLVSVSAFPPSISEHLTKFGQPDEIWLRIVDFEGFLVRLNLVYLQKGMAIGFVTDGYMQDNMIKGCFADEKKGLLRLVEPNTATSYKEFSSIFDLERRYLPLEEATNLTMAEFMQQFSDPTQPQCLETPIELWD